MLYGYDQPLRSKAIQYGVANENKAIQSYENQTGMKVEQCGLFVQSQWPYLGASPDGLVNDDGLVEVKCLPSIEKLSPKEAIGIKKHICIELIDGKVALKKNHHYWFQVQGQLNISNREWCDLILFSDGGLEVCEHLFYFQSV